MWREWRQQKEAKVVGLKNNNNKKWQYPRQTKSVFACDLFVKSAERRGFMVPRMHRYNDKLHWEQKYLGINIATVHFLPASRFKVLLLLHTFIPVWGGEMWAAVS